MRRCTGPVSCLPFEVVEKPNGLIECVGQTSSTHLATRLETRLSFISFFHSSHRGVVGEGLTRIMRRLVGKPG
jgi:hypothetical protein